MAESKITYVLALDVTKVTEGFKKVQEVEAVLNKNLHVLATDLGKIGESSWLNKAFGGTASANQKVLELANAMQTLKETTLSDYATRASLSSGLVKKLEAERTALESLRKSAILQGSAKGSLQIGEGLSVLDKQIAKYKGLADSMEKIFYRIETINDAIRYKQKANEPSSGYNLVHPSYLISGTKPKTWKASDILTASEVKILETNVQRIKKDIEALHIQANALNKVWDANKAAQVKAQMKASQTSASIIAKLQANINTQSANFHKQQATQQAQASANQIKQAQANSKAILAQLQANINAQAAANKLANQQAAAAARQATQQAVAQAKLSSQQITQASKTALATVPKNIQAPNVGATTPISQVVANPTNFINSLGTQTVNATAQLTAMQNALHGLITQLVAIPAGVLSPTALAASANAINLLNNATHTLTVNLGQLQTASMGIAGIINIFNTLQQATTLAWQGYQNLLIAIQDYRRGVTQAQFDTLNNVNAIKAELEERNRLRKAYNDLSPALKQAAAERQKELNLNRLLTEGYAKYVAQRDSAPTTQAGINYVQRLTSAWLAYQTQVQAAMQAAVTQGNAAVRTYEAQLKALERLQAKGSSYVVGKQVGFERTGTLNQMKASGASTDAVQGQKIRFQLEDIGKAYDKLVQKFQNKLLDPKLDQAGLARMRAGFLIGEAALLKQRDAAQKALGEIEKLTKGVHQLDQVHKPFLERIFDLVVGYKLINAAVNTFTNAMRSVPEAGLQFETTYATLKAVFSVTTKVNQELKFLDDLAQSAGISIDTLRSSFVDFAASAKFSGEKVENIQEIFANISKAGMVLHLPADKMKSAFTALNQMYAKNQVMMEELKRQLGNQLPAAVNIFALSMGKTTRQLMDDMKKGLVVPKETLLNFSRTYAAMFADPASLEYASQGVNAHIQRLSTAWTNFANKIYEESKGGIKGGLDIATNALIFLKENMTLLVNTTTILGSALGIALVTQLSVATKALLVARNAAMMASAGMVTLEAASASLAGLSIWSNMKIFATSTITLLPPWVKLVAILGTAVMVLKDLEVGTVTVKSSLNQLNGTAIDVKKSITLGGTVLAGWDLLIAKLEKLKDLIPKLKPDESSKNFITGLGNKPKEGNTPFWENAMLTQVEALFPAQARNIQGLYDASKQEEARRIIVKSAEEEAVRQTEALNERVKEALLAGTSGVVDETMAGMNKSITTALGRIEAEFSRFNQKLQSQLDIDTANQNTEIAKIQAREKLGSITALESMKQQHEVQRKISRLKEETAKKELQALEEKAKKEEALSERLVANSKEANAYNDAYLKLGTLQKFKQEMPQALVDSKAFKTTAEASKALESGTLDPNIINTAREQYNATHLDHGFKKIEDVSEKAITEATKRTVDTWKLYEAKMDAHTAAINQVSDGVIKTNDLAIEEKRIFEEMLARMPKPVDTSSVMTRQTPIDLAGLKFEQKIPVQSTFVSSALSAKVEASLAKGYENTAKYDNLIRLFSAQYKVDPNLAKTIMAIESHGVNGLVSSAGAGGLMQLIPTTAQAMGVKDVNNVAQNIEGGIKLLGQLSKQFNGDVDLIAAGYNAGANAVKRHNYQVPPYAETKDYVNKVHALYSPSASSIKSGEYKTEDATAKTLEEIAVKKAKIQEDAINQKNTDIATASDELIKSLEDSKAKLTGTFELLKTQKETELAKLDNLTFPLSDKERLAKTAEVNATINPELVSQIDQLVANAKETILRTANQATKSSLQTEILNLEKERASISAETLKDKTAIAINNVIPLQDALARKQFEIQSSLEDSLGILNEKTLATKQQLSQEETLKLLATEKLKLEANSSGLSKEEVAEKTKLIALTEKQLAQLNQIELMKAKTAKIEETTSTYQGYSDAASANLMANQASRMGISGNFIGTMATEETARNNYGVKQANFLSQIEAYKKQQLGQEGTNEWYKLQTQIEQTTTAMNDLAMAKDAVINQATADTINSISDHFIQWTQGAETVKQAFKGIAIDFAKMVQEILMNELKVQMVKGIMSMITGSFGGGFGSAATSAIDVGGGGGSPLFAKGGSITNFASGGEIRGTGTGTSDSIPKVVPIGSYVLNAKASTKAKKNRLINLSHGEVVISPEQVAQLGLDNLDTMNKQNYATGGLVGGSSSSASSAKGSKTSNITNINITVPEGTKNPKQFGQDVSVEIVKAIAREEAKKQVNMYNKHKTGGR
jgi:tape measure domain-containing protein